MMPDQVKPIHKAADLLDLEHIFSQRRLLPIDDFCTECGRRGLSLLQEQLEAFHRAGVLVPLFRIDKLPHARRLVWAEHIPLEQALARIQTIDFLQDHREMGTLHAPRQEPFKPWKNYKRMYGGITKWTSSFLYSPYQLLLVPMLSRLESRMRGYGKSIENLRFTLRLSARDGRVQDEVSENGALVIVLSALETRYLPGIPDETNVYLRRLSLDDALTYRRDFNVVQMFHRLGWEHDRLRQTAERLLWEARSHEPSTEWYKLLRLFHRDKWDTLKDGALIALDLRLAAELLLRFYDDVAAAGLAPPLDDLRSSNPSSVRVRSIFDECLRTDRKDLDEVLMDFGLSPHPSLILALEGETEMVIVPRVMQMLGIKDAPDFIRLFRYGGVKQPFSLLVQFVVAPALAERLESYGGALYPFARPPSKIMITGDPEAGPLDTPEKREKWKVKRLNAIMAELPDELNTEETRSDLEDHITFYVWSESFEFVNFEPGELASALEVPEWSIDWLRRKVKSFKLEHLWGKLKSSGYPLATPHEPSKTRLAQEKLWPMLEKRIALAIQEGNEEAIPVVKMVREAWRLAATTRRRQVAMFPPRRGEV